MVILNMYGKISPICISSKLKIFISNLPKEPENNWNQGLVEDMQQEIKERDIFITKYGHDISQYDLRKICMDNFQIKELSCDLLETEYLQIISDNLIYIFFDYEDEDMPFFDWTTNCFDGRLCEEDYAEKYMNFINFIIRNSEGIILKKTKIFPSCIYTSNHDREYSNLLGSLSVNNNIDLERYINSLIYWGEVIDKFLETKNDYFQLDYLINSIHKDNEYNAYHLFKVFSLLEMLLEKNTNNRKSDYIDKKLSVFLSETYQEKDEMAKMIRKMRNKIGHGDFLSLNDLLEEFAQKFMDGNYNYDYSEYSRHNWIYLHLCCELNEALAKVLFMLFTDRCKFNKMVKI